MRRTIGVLVALAVGCGGPVTSPDGGRDATVSGPDAGPPCARDQDCDDQRFCTGVERCMPGAAGARANGCVPGTAPCAEDETCDEAAGRCEGEACAEPDADADGYDSDACGGDDCDDTDPNRHPDNEEVCDPDHHDEDCDPATFGVRDEDGDGFPDARCCNMGVTLSCGTDCDDAISSIHPTAAERCDGLGVDEDCDSRIDEGERVDCYPDEDDDGYAAMGSATGAVCRDATRVTRGGCPPGFTNRMPADVANTDCDDTRLDRSPAAIELCNGQDDDCDGVDDDGYLCAAGATRACTANASCGGLSGTQRCAPTCESWSPCALADEGPTVAGTCNGCDDDLDGLADDNFACQRGASVPGCTTSCGTAGSRLCGSSCTLGPCRAADDACNYCDDDGDGLADDRSLTLASQAFDGDPVNVDSVSIQGFGAIGAGYLHSGASSIGVLEIARDITVGYGQLSFSAEVNIVASSSPQQGWAIWMYSTAAGSRGTPAAASYGAPWNRNGFSGEWAFNGSSIDSARLMALRTSATEIAIGSSSISGGTPSSALMELRVRPDDPTTTADETRVELYAGPEGVTPLRRALCDTAAGTSCRHRIRPGEEWRFGISHVSGAAGATATSMSLNGAALDVVVADACTM